MKKNRKIIALALSFVIMLQLVACQKESENISYKELSQSGDYTYEITDKITELDGDNYNYFAVKDKVYVSSFVYDANDKKKSVCTLYRYNSEFNNREVLKFPSDIDKWLMFGKLKFDEYGNSFYITQPENEPAYFVKIDKSGEETKRVACDEFIKEEDIQISDFCIGKDGIISAIAWNTIYFFDNELTYIGELKDNNIANVTVDRNGEFVCLLYGDDNLSVSLIDINTMKLTNMQTADFYEYMNLTEGIGEYDFYYSDDYGLYGFDLSSYSSQKLIDFMASNIDYTELIPLAKGKFLTEISEDEGETYLLAIYSKKKQTDNVKTLTFGTINMSFEVKEAISEFNRKNENCKIIVRDYAKEEEPIKKFNMDLISGNVPDLMDLELLSVDNYINKGLLENLLPYFDNDERVSTEDIMEPVLQACEMDNSLYYVSPCFDVFSLAAKKSDVGDAFGWNYDDLNRVLQNKDKDAQLLYLNYKQDLLRIFYYAQSGYFVDKDNAKCYFDSEDFKNLLQLCNERGVNDEEYEWGESEDYLLRNGKVLFRNVDSGFDYFKETLALFGEDVNFIGYPNEQKQGNFIDLYSKIGICSQSEYKTEAWEFISMLMSKEFQGGVMDFDLLPTRKDCFKLRLDAEMATEKFVNEMGRELSPSYTEVEINGKTLYLEPMTKEQVEQYIDMVNRSTQLADFDENILEIVQEEAAGYFNGDQSLDNVVKIIQKRVTTYINEIQ